MRLAGRGGRQPQEGSGDASGWGRGARPRRSVIRSGYGLRPDEGPGSTASGVRERFVPPGRAGPCGPGAVRSWCDGATDCREIEGAEDGSRSSWMDEARAPGLAGRGACAWRPSCARRTAAVGGGPCERRMNARARTVVVRGVAQPGSAPALGAGGRWFESSLPDQSPVALFRKMRLSGLCGLRGDEVVCLRSRSADAVPFQ